MTEATSHNGLNAPSTSHTSSHSEATAATGELDARERSALEEALGFGTRGARPRQAASALKELDDQQKARAKRYQRDALDRALTELTGYYRDVLSVQTRADVQLTAAILGHLNGSNVGRVSHREPTLEDAYVALVKDE